MRIVTATLVLVLLVGTQARHFWQQDEPQQTALGHMQDAFNLYVETLKTGINEGLSQIETSHLGQTLDLKLGKAVGTVSEVLAKIQEELAPAREALKAKIDTELERLHKDLAEVQPIIDRFSKNVWVDLEDVWGKLPPIGQELHEISRANLESLRQKLQPVAESTRDNLRSRVDELRKEIAPHADVVRQKVSEKLQELSEKLQELSEKKLPEWSQHQTQVQQQIAALYEKIKTDVSPFFESLKVKLTEVLATAQKKLEQQQS